MFGFLQSTAVNFSVPRQAMPRSSAPHFVAAWWGSWRRRQCVVPGGSASLRFELHLHHFLQLGGWWGALGRWASLRKAGSSMCFFYFDMGGGMLGPRSDMIINAESKVGRWSGAPLTGCTKINEQGHSRSGAKSFLCDSKKQFSFPPFV